MKSKTVKKMMAAMAAAALITATSVPTLAAENVVTATNAFGVEYSVDYGQGAANIGGRRIYFGFTPESTYVRTCGWIGGVSLRAREIADLMSHDPAWWVMWSKQFPTVEQWEAWRRLAPRSRSSARRAGPITRIRRRSAGNTRASISALNAE